MRILIAVAHADDETLGCSTILTGKNEVYVLHATDSAPRDLKFAARAGYQTRERYRDARHRELLSMLYLAGIREDRYQCLGIADQEAPMYWRRIREYVRGFEAERVYTHAYEGGHPDHDAVAFALAGLPNVWEFPLYHRHGGEFVPHTFLSGVETETHVLDPARKARKQELLDCFRSQTPILRKFPVEKEVFRPAIAYDFAAPPHPGELYYEARNLGWTWPEWREAITSPSPSAAR
jgi:LmbE family N-acetylglucosaminyl deacetylase